MTEFAATIRTFAITVLVTFSLAVGFAALGAAARSDAAPPAVSAVFQQLG